MSFENLLTANDVSEVLQIDLQRVYSLTRKQLLPTVKLGERQYRYSRQAMERFIENGGNQTSEVMKDENKSEAAGANCGLMNPFDYLSDNQRLFVFDYDEKQETLQSNLTANLARHKKVIRLYRCFGCEKNRTAQKMSNCLVVCRDCYDAAQGKGKIARKNFVEKTLNNFHKFLRRRIAI